MLTASKPTIPCCSLSPPLPLYHGNPNPASKLARHRYRYAGTGAHIPVRSYRESTPGQQGDRKQMMSCSELFPHPKSPHSSQSHCHNRLPRASTTDQSCMEDLKRESSFPHIRFQGGNTLGTSPRFATKSEMSRPPPPEQCTSNSARLAII